MGGFSTGIPITLYIAQANKMYIWLSNVLSLWPCDGLASCRQETAPCKKHWVIKTNKNNLWKKKLLKYNSNFSYSSHVLVNDSNHWGSTYNIKATD